MNTKLYDEYEKLNFMISNPDIFGLEAPSKLRDFIKDNKLTDDMIAEFDKQMESECKDGNSICKLETLSSIEYITFMAMMGNLSKYWVIDYMSKMKIELFTALNKRSEGIL